MKYMLGIDAGTSNIKAVLIDELGDEIGTASCENETIRVGTNQLEQDMDEIWEKVKYCIRSVLQSENIDRENIIGIGVTAQGEGCWLIDKEGKPVHRAILWCDGRAVDVVDEMTREYPELGKRYHATTGTPPSMGNQLVLLKWMKENCREILDRADKLFFCKDWIRYKLTGEIQTEITDCFTSLVDVDSGEIAIDLMEALGVAEYRDYLPDPVGSDQVTGHVLDSVAEELGLKPGTPVIAGALDICSMPLGAGAIHEGEVCVILGTTCVAEINTRKEHCAFGTGNTRYEKYPVGEMYIQAQPTLNGVTNIHWMLEQIADTRDFHEIDKIVESVPVGCEGVIYHPYISPAGERAPFYHPYARASFFGISQTTTRAALIRAVYEGLSLSIRDCLGDADRSGTIFLTGGGARSPVWAQMIADVTGMKVMVPSGKEFGAKGAALMAGVACGLYKDYEEAIDKACRFTCTYEPDRKNAEKYELIYELYKFMRVQNDQLWNAGHELNAQLRKLDMEESR